MLSRSLFQGAQTRLRQSVEALFGCLAREAFAWTSKMAKILDPILSILSILGYWAIILGIFGGPGEVLEYRAARLFEFRVSGPRATS